MRLARPLLLLLVLLVPTASHAYTFGPWGVNLRWDNCYGDGGVANKNFACDTNSGAESLVASFVPAWDIQGVHGLEVVMDLASASASWPAWWAFKNPGTCRQTSLVFTTTPSPVPVNCPDWGSGMTAGGIGAYNIGNRGPNTARILLAMAVPAAQAAELTGRSEYFAFRLTVNHLKTVDSPVCAGCNVPVCILLTSVNQITPLQSTSRWLTGPANQVDSDFATWQGGGVPVVGPVTGCPAATPAKTQTWGEVKALYR